MSKVIIDKNEYVKLLQAKLKLDILECDGVYTVRGTQNKGAYVRLREIKKVPSIKLLQPYKFNKGIVWL